MVANVSIPTVQFTNNSANTTTLVAIGAAGTLQSNPIGNATTASPSGLIIAPGPGNVTIGSVVVTDAGHMIGTVDFSRVIGTGFAGNATSPPNISNTTVAVTGNGVWLTSGTSSFGNGALGAGNATVASDSVITGGPGGNGAIETVGNTTFAYGVTTANSFTNIGVTQVGSDGAPSTLRLTGGPILLTNAGLIDLSTGAANTDFMVGTTTAFNGIAGGVIATKTPLAGPGALGNTLTVAAVLPTSVNNIKVTDAGGVAAFVPITNGIVLVHTLGAATNAGAFVLDPGSTGYTTFGPSAHGLLKGVWLYTLANTGQNEVLVSSPGPGGFEAPIVATAAQNIWWVTSPWQDRQADLRDSALLAPGDLGSFEPGVWIKAVGDWVNRTDKIDPPAGFTFDLDYQQNTYGVIAGIDGAGRVGGGVGLIGVAGGYLNSQLNFNNHVGLSDQNYDGGTAAIYATWLMDQFYIDGMFKGDFLTLSANAFGGSNSISVDTYGGRVEAGYRFPIGMGTIEPVGTIGYTQTDIGNANVLGTTLHWGNENSFRGSLGGRFSVPVVTNDSYMIKLAVEARVWDEFDGRNTAVLISGSPATSIGVGDNFSGTFGEVGGSANLFSKDGHSSAFLNGRRTSSRTTTAKARSRSATGISGALRRRRRLHRRRLPAASASAGTSAASGAPWPRTSSSTSRSISTC